MHKGFHANEFRWGRGEEGLRTFGEVSVVPFDITDRTGTLQPNLTGGWLEASRSRLLTVTWTRGQRERTAAVCRILEA
ncbi:hypothetical protein GN956_G4979 [Arapaima gigas]